MNSTIEVLNNYLVNVDLRIEATVLGSAINQPQLVASLLKTIQKPSVFYDPFHQQAYQAIARLYEQGEVIDLVTIRNYLKKQGHDPVEAFTKLISLTENAYAVSIDHHCKILYELAVKRYMGQYGQRLVHAANDPTTDALQLLERLNGDVDGIMGSIAAMGERQVSDYLRDVFTELDAKKAGKRTGLTFGIDLLDQRTGGWEPGNYVILAGGTGQGKTGFCTHIIRHRCLELNSPVGLFSLEMSGSEVLKRLIASETNYSNSEINRGAVDLALIHKQASSLAQMPLYVHDKPVQALDLQFKVREWVRRYGVKLVIIDYLQLIKDPRYKSAYERVSNLSMDLKALAQELGIVILALSQLSREYEKRKGWDMRPKLSDLRESGQLEQDANAVLMLFRPHKYGLEYEGGGVVNEHTLELHGLKFRSAKATERESPFLFDYDGATNKLLRYGALSNGFSPNGADMPF